MPYPPAVQAWGSSSQDRGAAYACDALIERPEVSLYRAVDVAAPARVVFRWLCQLRVAPYSYDWVDNFGRRSPRALTEGLERLEAGQTFMTIFRLVAFDDDRSITLHSSTRLLGRVALTYVVVPCTGNRSRLVVKLLNSPPTRRWGVAVRWLLPPGDLVMMRKQLLTLKALAEADVAAGSFAPVRAQAPADDPVGMDADDGAPDIRS